MKYSKQQLKNMAIETLQAKENGDFRYINLVVMLMTLTGWTEQQVEEKIQALADVEL